MGRADNYSSLKVYYIKLLLQVFQQNLVIKRRLRVEGEMSKSIFQHQIVKL